MIFVEDWTGLELHDDVERIDVVGDLIRLFESAKEQLDLLNSDAFYDGLGYGIQSKAAARSTNGPRQYAPFGSARARCALQERLCDLAVIWRFLRVLMCSRAKRRRASSFDYLIGARDERRRKLEAKCLGSLEIDDKIELRGLEYR